MNYVDLQSMFEKQIYKWILLCDSSRVVWIFTKSNRKGHWFQSPHNFINETDSWAMPKEETP